MAGMGVAHRLLKYTLPHEKDLKVIVVSKVRYLNHVHVALMCPLACLIYDPFPCQHVFNIVE